ncbi:MAG: hypothetical protein ACK5X3_23850 [Pseudomonadota bacterium]
MNDELIEKMARAFFEKMFERTPAPATFDAIMAADRLIGSENEFMAGMRAALSVIREAGYAVVPRVTIEMAVVCLRVKARDAARDMDSAAANFMNTNADRLEHAMIAASPIGEK